MSMDTGILSQLWQGALTESVPASQKWVLRSMRQYGPGLVTMLWRMLGNEHDVCDVYQDTFLHLAHSFSDRPRPRHVRAYLYKASMNIAISILRRKRIERQYEKTLSKRTGDSFRMDYARELDVSREQEKLRRAIGELPQHLADVVMLRDLGQLPYADVAAVLGISQTAARVYRHKAIRLLAAMLDGEETAGER
jgi:RNA polymerase sigma-70 factor (ECF subfamily)